jgi:hypothetical protein
MVEIVNTATSMRACFPASLAANVRSAGRRGRRGVEYGQHVALQEKNRGTGAGCGADPERHELLQSQLRETLTYGWSDKETHDAVAFLQSLPAADDTSHIGDRLGGSSPR